MRRAGLGNEQDGRPGCDEGDERGQRGQTGVEFVDSPRGYDNRCSRRRSPPLNIVMNGINRANTAQAARSRSFPGCSAIVGGRESDQAVQASWRKRKCRQEHERSQPLHADILVPVKRPTLR
jgi:hypothetical protein